MHIGLVVEGQGEIGAVPILVRDYLHENEIWQPEPGTPYCAKSRSNLTKDDGIERFVRLAASEEGACGVLVVLDAEGDDVCPTGPDLTARASGATHLPVRVCLAVRQFENWIVGSAETLFDAPNEIEPLAVSEGPGAVARLEEGLHPTKYNKPVYQPRLTKRMDRDLAAGRCRSLTRLFRCIDELVEASVS